MSLVHFSRDTLPELSNFYALPQPLSFNGLQCATSEHLYQAMKYAYFADRAAAPRPALIAEICRQSTPYKAKILAGGPGGMTSRYDWERALKIRAKQYADQGVVLSARWDDVRVSVMADVLRLKFFTSAACRAALLATDRNAVLVERTDTDAFWGDGRDGKGRNELGKLLTALRNEWLDHGVPLIAPVISVESVDL